MLPNVNRTLSVMGIRARTAPFALWYQGAMEKKAEAAAASPEFSAQMI